MQEMSSELSEVKTQEDLPIHGPEIGRLSGLIAKGIEEITWQAGPLLYPRELISQIIKVDQLTRQIALQITKEEFNPSLQSELEKEFEKLGEQLRSILGLSEFDSFGFRVRRFVHNRRFRHTE